MQVCNLMAYEASRSFGFLVCNDLIYFFDVMPSLEIMFCGSLYRASFKIMGEGISRAGNSQHLGIHHSE